MGAVTLWNIFEVISGKFPRAEIELFHADINKGWTNFEIILCHM